MSESRMVTAETAQEWLDTGAIPVPVSSSIHNLLHTIIHQAARIERLELSLSIAAPMADKWAAYVDETIGDIGDD